MPIKLAALDKRLLKIFGAQAGNFSKAMRDYLVVALQTGQASREARDLLAREAETASKKMSAAARYWAPIRLKQAAKDGVKDLGFGGVNIRLVARLAAESTKDLLSASEGPKRLLSYGLRRGKAIATSRELEAVNLDTRLTESIARGVLRQEAPRQLQRSLMSDLKLNKGDIIMLENGQKWDATAYTETVAMTRPIEAANLAKLDAIKASGGEYIITSSHSGVEDQVCLDNQGQVFALKGADPLGFPTLPADVGFPPWHPRCGHTFGVWSPTLYSDAEIQDYLDAHEEK